ncbi:hypothetical protein [Streptomyces antibioticus]|uniref:hypothetical protein n=1 Tax=Streptomyces antibioticus TaxID=1890 RepID=UPI003D70EB3A
MSASREARTPRARRPLDDAPVKAETIAAAQDIPHEFLEGVTAADMAADALPAHVTAPAAEPAAWENP